MDRKPLTRTDKDVANKLIDLYVSYRARYVICKDGHIYIPKDNNDKSKSIKLTNATLCGHVGENYSIGVFAGKVASKFICFDVDDGDCETVEKIVSACVEIGFPKEKIHVSLSGSKGYHVEIFFAELVKTKALQGLYWEVVSSQGLNPKKVEFRPTHKQAIKLPLSVHHKTRNKCWFVDRDTLEPIKSVAYALQINPVDLCQFAEIKALFDKYAAEDDLIKVQRNLLQDPKYHELFENNTLPVLNEFGTRHETAIAIACAQRYKGVSQEECLDTLLSWCEDNKSFITSSSTEVLKDIGMIVTWAYGDSFIPKHEKCQPRPRKRTISSKEALYTLQPCVRSMQRLLWVIMCHNNVYGRCALTLERLGKLVGVSVVSVCKSLKRLEKEEWISVSRKKPRHIDGSFVREVNSYFINHKRLNEMDLETLDVEIPICFAEMDLDFNATYSGALLKLLPDNGIKVNSSRSESKHKKGIWIENDKHKQG